MATDLNSGMLGKTFKTATLGGGFGALKNNADTLRGFVMQDPALLEKIGGEKALNDYIKQHQQAAFWNPETSGDFKFSDETKKIDELLAGYQMNSVGHAGMDDGRAKAIVKDGQTLYAGDAYSYKPAKDTLDTVLKGAALVGGAYAAFSPGGMLSGIGAGNGATGAAAGAGEAGALSGLDAAALDAGAGLSGGAGGSVVGAAEAAGAAGAAGGASQLTPAALESLVGTSGYGANAAADLFAATAGMAPSGAGVSVFDTALAAIKNVGLNAVGAVSPSAASALSGSDWLSSTWSALTGTGGGNSGGGLLGSLLSNSSILALIGAGVQQYNLEKMASDQRAWQDKKESDARRRRMPTTGTGMLGKFRVIPGAGNGG